MFCDFERNLMPSREFIRETVAKRSSFLWSLKLREARSVRSKLESDTRGPFRQTLVDFIEDTVEWKFSVRLPTSEMSWVSNCGKKVLKQFKNFKKVKIEIKKSIFEKKNGYS